MKNINSINIIKFIFFIIGNLPPTVELNALAMKRGEATVYTFRQAPPAGLQQYVTNSLGHFPRIFNPRFPTYNRGFHAEPQLYLVSLKVKKY